MKRTPQQPQSLLARALAVRASALQFQDLNEAALHWAKVSILDTVGVMLAGGQEEGVRILAECCAPADGTAVLVSSGKRSSAMDAALINGMAAHVLDFDTSNDRFSGHPTVQLLPAVLALGQTLSCTGRDLIAAYVAGFEVQGRVASMIAPQHFEKGWFSTSAIGVLGAAAGASHLLRLDAEACAHVLGTAAMMSCGSVSHAGSMTKPMASGHAARNGLLAALLAQQGFTAAPDSLDGPRGLLRLMVASEYLQIDTHLNDWGSPLLITETAQGIKLYPCCGIFHSALDVLGELVRQHGFSASEVAEIEAQLFTSRLAHIDRPMPAHDEDAKFSAQHCLAVVAAKGRLGLDDFGEERREDPTVGGLRGKIHVSTHRATDFSRGKVGQGGCEVTVLLNDGRRFTGAAKKPRGRLPEEPLSSQQVSAKFLLCAERRLPGADAEELLEKLWALEHVENVQELLSGLN